VRASISLDGRAARLGTIPLCGALGSLRLLSRRVHDANEDDDEDVDDDDEVLAREGLRVALMRGHVRHVRSGELARRRTRAATPNDHRSTTPTAPFYIANLRELPQPTDIGSVLCRYTGVIGLRGDCVSRFR